MRIRTNISARVMPQATRFLIAPSDSKPRAGLASNIAAMMKLGALQRICGFFSTSLLARILGQEGFSGLAFTQSSAHTFFGLTRLGADAGVHVGLAHAATPGSAASPGSKDSAQAIVGEGFSFFLLIAGVTSTAVAASAGWISDKLFSAPDLRP